MKYVYGLSFALCNILLIESYSYSQESYLSCDKNDIVINYDTQQEKTQYTIVNKKIVKHFKNLVPNLIYNDANKKDVNLYNKNGLMSFTSDKNIFNNSYSNSTHTSYLSQTFPSFRQKNTNRRYMMLASRVNEVGLKVEVHETNSSDPGNMIPISTTPLAEWNFKECELKNKNNPSFDPLNYKNNFSINASGATEESKKIFDRRLSYLKNKDIDGILSDYSDSAQILLNDKIINGKAEIRQFFEKLSSLAGNIEGYNIKKLVISNEIINIVWNVKINGVTYPVGSDTFVIIDGKIKYQIVTADEKLFKSF